MSLRLLESFKEESLAKYIGSKCRMCRREGGKLFLKGERCFTTKCAMEQKRRPYPPGEHGFGRRKTSEYGFQLREKQKVRRIYGVLEKQFVNYFYKADRQKGITGENLLQMLERRLDNVVYRFGFASSRVEARQLVRHRHFMINSRRVNVPSMQVRVGDEITVIEKSRKMDRINIALESVERRGIPAWLELEKNDYKGTIKQLPSREDIQIEINERLIVELYSK